MAGSTAFDVGAQHANDSLVVAGLTDSRVLAFDCDPTCVRVMEPNLQMTPGPAGVLEPVETAVGDGADQTGLDEYTYSEAGFVPDFIKIVVGGEVGALRCARRLLDERRPALIVRVHSAELKRPRGQLLSERGYKPVLNHVAFLPDHRPITELNRWLLAADRGTQF